MVDVHDRLDGLSPRGWTLLAAGTFGIGGAVVASIVISMLAVLDTTGGSSSSEALPMIAGAGLGGLLCGGYFWWTIIESPRTISPLQGVAVGFLAGIVAHFVMWAVVSSGLFVAEGMSNSGGTSVGDLLFGVAGYTFFSILIFGLFTGVVGAAIGWALARVRKASLGEPPIEQEPSTRDELGRLGTLSRRRWTLLAAAVFGVIGLLPGLLLSLVSGDLVSYASVSALSNVVVGGFLWWAIVERPKSVSPVRGLTVGGSTVLSTHFAMSGMLSMLESNSATAIGSTSQLLGFILSDVAVFGLVTIIWFGILTVPAGSIAGLGLVRLRAPSFDVNSTDETDHGSSS